jgi:hypothetical protein
VDTLDTLYSLVKRRIAMPTIVTATTPENTQPVIIPPIQNNRPTENTEKLATPMELDISPEDL